MSDDRLAQMIGERVRFYRTASRRTKAVVAGLAGITPDYLYQIERGQKVPTVALLTQLAVVLRVSIGELVGGQPEREAKHSKAAASDAIYRALTSPVMTNDEPPNLRKLRRGVQEAWRIWQTSPYRYSQLTQWLPALIVDIEVAVRKCQAERASTRRAAHGCASDLYGLLRTVTKRIGRIDLSLLAADRAIRAAEAADDPLRLAASHWNMTQVLLADGAPEAAQVVAIKAAENLQPLMRNGIQHAIALYGSLILLEAVAAARNGDAWTARDRVRQAAPLAEKTGECNAYWTAFGPTVERHSRCRCRVADHGEELWITPGAELPDRRRHCDDAVMGRLPHKLPTYPKASRPAPQARSVEERKRRGSTVRPSFADARVLGGFAAR